MSETTTAYLKNCATSRKEDQLDTSIILEHATINPDATYLLAIEEAGCNEYLGSDEGYLVCKGSIWVFGGNYFYRADTEKQSSVICPHDLLIPVSDLPTRGGWFVVDGRTFKAGADGTLEFQLKIPKSEEEYQPLSLEHEMPKSTPHDAQDWAVGDVLYSSSGWQRTNADFAVVSGKTDKTVWFVMLDNGGTLNMSYGFASPNKAHYKFVMGAVEAVRKQQRNRRTKGHVGRMSRINNKNGISADSMHFWGWDGERKMFTG